MTYTPHPFVVEYRDARGRWHRKRGAFETVDAARIAARDLVAVRSDACTWRVRSIRYRETLIVASPALDAA